MSPPSGELRHVLESAWSPRGDEYLIERLRRVLVRQPDPSQLVVEIAELLQRYPFGLSGSEIARRLGRREGPRARVVARRFELRTCRHGTGNAIPGNPARHRWSRQNRKAPIPEPRSPTRARLRCWTRTTPPRSQNAL